MPGQYNRRAKTSRSLSSSSDDNDDTTAKPRNTSNRAVRSIKNKMSGGVGGQYKIRRKTSAALDSRSSSDDFNASSDENQPSFSSDNYEPSSSSDNYQPSSSDECQSSSSSDDSKSASSSDDLRSSIASDDMKTPSSSDESESSSDDDVIPQPKYLRRGNSSLAFRSTNARMKPGPPRRLKTSAVLDSSSSDDDAIPSTSLGTSVGSSRKLKLKSPQTVTVVKHVAPPPPLKRTLPVPALNATGGPPYPPKKKAKIDPIPNPNLLSTPQMNSALLFYAKSVRQLQQSQVTVPIRVAPVPPPPLKSSPSVQQNVSSTSTSRPVAAIQPSTSTNRIAPKSYSVCPESAVILKKISPDDFTNEFLQSGAFHAKLLTYDDSAYKLISEYITNSQAHPNFKVYLHTVLEISRSSAPTITNPQGPDPPKLTMMLWHGTKPQNLSAILKNGFRCPPTGAQMFGQGVYFADRVSKSAQYCSRVTNFMRPLAGDVGYLFLCEVVVGKWYNARVSNPTYKSVPTATRRNGSVMTFDSVKCTGENVPDREMQREIDGVVWPLGRTVKNDKFQAYTVLYNEYIVYDPEQIKIKFLVKVIFG